MITHVDNAVAAVDVVETGARSKPHVPSYQVRWSPWQRLSRWWTKPLTWLWGRLYRRFLQLNAGAVAFWLAELPIVFTVVATLTRLRIFDRVEHEPQTSEELAQATGTNRDSLHRFLRAAAVF